LPKIDRPSTVRESGRTLVQIVMRTGPFLALLFV
jgi:hypothetical protein